MVENVFESILWRCKHFCNFHLFSVSAESFLQMVCNPAAQKSAVLRKELEDSFPRAVVDIELPFFASLVPVCQCAASRRYLPAVVIPLAGTKNIVVLLFLESPVTPLSLNCKPSPILLLMITLAANDSNVGMETWLPYSAGLVKQACEDLEVVETPRWFAPRRSRMLQAYQKSLITLAHPDIDIRTSNNMGAPKNIQSKRSGNELI